MDSGLAYFITFTCYGCWLHGDERGSVDREHNAPGTPFVPADDAHRGAMRERMDQPLYLMDATRRAAVLDSMVEVCAHAATLKMVTNTSALSIRIPPLWQIGSLKQSRRLASPAPQD